jgi:hypothetical protein
MYLAVSFWDIYGKGSMIFGARPIKMDVIFKMYFDSLNNNRIPSIIPLIYRN